MRKILTLFLFLMSSFMMAQSYIGQNYDKFFANMIAQQEKQNNYIIGGPTKSSHTDAYDVTPTNYSITITWKNSNTGGLMISHYLFSKDNVCLQITQFSPLDDRELIHEIIKLVKEKFTVMYTKSVYEDYWLEYKGDITVRHEVYEKEFQGVYGVMTSSTKY